MNYCASKGIPHSVFLGWEQADREKALAWAAREASRCSGCGVPYDEQHDFKPYTYRCLVCEKLQPINLDPKTEGHGMYKRAVPVGFEETEQGEPAWDLAAASRGKD